MTHNGNGWVHLADDLFRAAVTDPRFPHACAVVAACFNTNVPTHRVTPSRFESALVAVSAAADATNIEILGRAFQAGCVDHCRWVPMLVWVWLNIPDAHLMIVDVAES
jgi:hypothetical protein